MKFITLSLILMAVAATVQAYDPFSKENCPMCVEYEPFVEPRDAGAGYSNHSEYMDNLQRKFDRRRRLQLMEEQAMREEARIQERSRLRECAPYNRGCAQELYGRDWP